MSVNISISRVDKVGADALMDAILDGSYQKAASERVPMLLDEIDNYPEISDEEIYKPEFNTPDAKAAISKRLARREEIKAELKRYTWIPDHIDQVNTLRNNPENEDYESWVSALADDVISINSDSFHSPLWDVQVCIDLLFKHAGYAPEETEALEEVPFSKWSAVFNNLNKELLQNMKDEIDANPYDYGSFDECIDVLKEVRRIHKGCDGENILFSVMVEGDGNRLYQESLEARIKDHLKKGPIDSVDLRGRKVPAFW